MRRSRPLQDDEAGLTLVEMMIAIFVISVGMLALLSSFGASARSLHAQRTLAGATRVASTVLEGIRSAGYDAAASSAAPSSVVHNGITYTVTHTVTETDVDGDTSDPDIHDDVKELEVVVTWTGPSGSHTRTYRTALARQHDTVSATPGPALGDLSVSPTAVDVDDDGDTTSAVDVTIPVSGFSVGDTVTLTWSDDNGSHSELLMWTEGTSAFVHTIAAGGIRVGGLADGATTTVEFTATTGSLSKSVSLTLRNPSDAGVEITSASISPSQIRVKKISGSCDQPHKCTNVDPITFTAYVSGFDTTQNADWVRVRVPLQDGSNAEIVLIRDATDLTKWSVTIDAGQLQVRGPSGSNMTEIQTFTFIAKRASGDGAEDSLDVDHPVHRQN